MDLKRISAQAPARARENHVGEEVPPRQRLPQPVRGAVPGLPAGEVSLLPQRRQLH